MLDGTDYVGGQFPIDFPANTTVVSLNITIINDDEPPVEEREIFEMDIEDRPNGVLQGRSGVVRIIDDCTRVCQNGGTLDSSICNCTCPAAYTGLSCESEQFCNLFNECSCMFIHPCTDGHC